jgi:hypothetical protein
MQVVGYFDPLELKDEDIGSMLLVPWRRSARRNFTTSDECVFRTDLYSSALAPEMSK